MTMESIVPRIGAYVLGTFIDALTWEDSLARIRHWAHARESRYVCICNVHSVVTAHRDISVRHVMAQAYMTTPDGMPVAWMLRILGFSGQQRINGPDLMWQCCVLAAHNNEPVYLYGSAPETLEALSARLARELPRLRIAGTCSPPFRPLTVEEDAEIVARINASGAGVVFVSLGCPKQEVWMAQHRGRINAVMVGVGAAFDYHAGTLKRAPLWMQQSGLEWLHRLTTEPRRLWKRYLVTNTLFVIGAVRQLLLAK